MQENSHGGCCCSVISRRQRSLARAIRCYLVFVLSLIVCRILLIFCLYITLYKVISRLKGSPSRAVRYYLVFVLSFIVCRRLLLIFVFYV